MQDPINFPTPTHVHLAETATHYFDVAQVEKALDGYDDINLLVRLGSGEKYVLKLTLEADSQPFLVAQNTILRTLDNSLLPSPLPTRDGELLKEIVLPDGRKGYLRALRYLDGQFLGDIAHHSTSLLRSLGTFFGCLDRKMAQFDYLAIRQRQHRWDIANALQNEGYLAHVPAPADKRLLRYYFQQFREQVLPVQHQLPRQTIHGDGNDWNILVRQDQVCGLIDFGDMCYTWRVAEVSILLTYALLGKADPLPAASHLLAAYHQELPLSPLEVDLLYVLIATRLVVSTCNSAYQRALAPHEAYLFITEKAAWELLHRWHQIPPATAKAAFYSACGFPPPPVTPIAKLQETRRAHFSPAMSISYGRQPLHMQGAALQYMYAADGRSYLDCVNNIMHVGHCHPHVVRAAQAQIGRLNTNTRYFYDGLTEYAKRLTSTLPEGLDRVFLVNSGSAATDLALRIARTYTQRKAMLVLGHGYHGNTTTGIEVSAYKFRGKGGSGTAAHVYEAPLPDLYRGPWTADDPQAVAQYVAQAQQLIAQAETAGQAIAAFIAEAIVGCGGQVPLPPGYLSAVYAAVRAQGGVCIADEVQTGFGRVGHHFWAFEASDVIPDMVILGKPIGNGHPMAAVVCTEALAEAFANGMEFFSSFGGNPVSCAIGQAVLEVIEEEDLQAHATRIGAEILQDWRSLEREFETVGNVRGSGLFLGMELIAPGTAKTPNAALANRLVLEMRAAGILLSTDGPFHNVIKFKPPMPFSKSNAAQVTEHIRRILNENPK